MSLNDLDAAPLNDGVDVANLPDQAGSFTPPPQPGPYRFELSPLKDANFEATGEGNKYVRVKFDDAAPLVIVQAIDPNLVKTPFQTQLSNVPRKRGKGDDAPVASDWDYLNQGLKVSLPVPRTTKAYATSLLAKSAERAQFAADVEWSWNCNEKREAYFDDGAGGSAPVPHESGTGNIAGCGKRQYQRDIQKVDGAFPLRITCACGATVRAFANLVRFRE